MVAPRWAVGVTRALIAAAETTRRPRGDRQGVVDGLCRLYGSVEGLAAGSVRRPLILDHLPTLHHERNLFRLTDVLQGISRHRHDVGELAGLEGADLVG